MNRRIAKKRIAQYDAMIAEGLRLYAARPTGQACEDVARSLLSLQIGLALNGRFQVAPGARRGWGVAPPTDVVVEHADTQSLRAHGWLRLLPPGNHPDVVEEFHFAAERSRNGWRHTLVTVARTSRSDAAAV